MSKLAALALLALLAGCTPYIECHTTPAGTTRCQPGVHIEVMP